MGASRIVLASALPARTPAPPAREHGGSRAGKLLLGSATVLCGLSCGGGFKELDVDPSYQYENLLAGGIVVVGVTSTVPGLDAGVEARVRQQEAWSGMLYDALAATRPDLRTLPPDSLVERLGSEEYHLLLDRYGASTDLDAGALAEIDRATGGTVRYVVAGRLEEDRVSNHVDEEEEEIDSREEEEGGKRFSVSVVQPSYSYETTRRVVFRMSVFDCREGRVVYSGHMDRKWTASRIEYQEAELRREEIVPEKEEEEEEDGGGLLGGLLSIGASLAAGAGEQALINKGDELLGFRDGTYPPPPDLDSSLRSVFTEFAASVPRR